MNFRPLELRLFWPPLAMIALVAFLMWLIFEINRKPDPPPPDEGFRPMEDMLAEFEPIEPPPLHTAGPPDGCQAAYAMYRSCDPAGAAAVLIGASGTCTAGPEAWILEIDQPGFRGSVRCEAGACLSRPLVIGGPEGPASSSVSGRWSGCEATFPGPALD